MTDELKVRLDAYIGRSTGGRGPSRAPDPVNVPMIRHWVDALDDQNPIYLDEAAARNAGHTGVVAPPAMLQTWTMGRPTIQGLAERGGAAGDIGDSPLRVLDEEGYTSIVATNSELEFDRYLVPGDHLESSSVFESVSERKTTGRGTGYFVTWVTTYTDQTGATVGRQRFRVFKFKPSRP